MASEVITAERDIPAQEAEKIRQPQQVARFVVGTVVEINRDGVKKKALSVTPKWAKSKLISEDTLPFLKDREVNEVLAFEKKLKALDSTLKFRDRLGMNGELAAARRVAAYERGFARVFPEECQEDIDWLESKGQGHIDEEIDRAKQANNYVDARESGWRQAYKHGEGRVNFTHIPCVTIDPKTAKDYDDALSMRYVTRDGKEHSGDDKDGKKYVEVAVHIADVSHFLSMQEGEKGYQLFQEAKRRQFTAYPEGDEAFPMLPPILAEDLCSLREDVERLAFSTVFLIDPDDNKIIDTWHGKTVVRSAKRLNYESADMLRQDDGPVSEVDAKLRNMLRELTKYGKALREERKGRGSVGFNSRPEADIAYDEDDVSKFDVKKSNEMNYVVEDWMVKANEAMALCITERSHATKGAIPTLLRIHEAPALKDVKAVAEEFDLKDIVRQIEEFEKRQERAQRGDGEDEPNAEDEMFVNRIVNLLLEQKDLVSEKTKKALRKRVTAAQKAGKPHPLLGPNPDVTADRIADRFKEINRDQQEKMLNRVQRLITKARWTTAIERHFGLGAYLYTNGTSPIRRFPDVMVHLLMNSALSNEKVSTLNEAMFKDLVSFADYANHREREATRFERQSWRMRGAQLLSKRIGSTLNVRIDGIRYDPKDPERPPMIFAEILFFGNRFPITFPLTVREFRYFPRDPNRRRELEGKRVKVKLLDADFRTGFIKLEYLPRVRKAQEKPGKELSAEAVAQKKKRILQDLDDLGKEFKAAITAESDTAKEIEKLTERRMKTLAVKTPDTVFVKWYERIGAIKGQLLYDMDVSAAQLEEEQPSEQGPTVEEIAQREERRALQRRSRELAAEIERKKARLADLRSIQTSQ